MSIYALEREYSSVQKSGIVAKMFYEPARKGKVTARQAACEAGCSIQRAYEILEQLVVVLHLYKEGTHYVMDCER